VDASAFHLSVLPHRPVPEIADLAAEADLLGFGGLWAADSQSIFRDAFQTLAVCATRTSRLKLATGVTNPLTRHVAVLAGAAATLHELSGGRAILGIGVGASAVRLIGLRPARLSQLESTTHALRALLAGEAVPVDGREIRQRWSGGSPPIVYAASGPKALRLAGRLADGVLFHVGSHPQLVRYGLESIEVGVREAGRAVAEVPRILRLSCVIDDDPERARERARGSVVGACAAVNATVPQERMPAGLHDDLARLMERFTYGPHTAGAAGQRAAVTDALMDAIAVVGTPDEAARRFRELWALGLDGFCITSEEPLETMRALAEEVIPRV
jgi:5,10-methylenetetrahydromethanopterin reductase